MKHLAQSLVFWVCLTFFSQRGFAINDLKIMDLQSHRYELAGPVSFSFLFQNWGTQTVQNFSLKWSLNNQLYDSLDVNVLSTWAGGLGISNSQSTINFPLTLSNAIQLNTQGNYLFKLWITRVNGLPDDNTSNDTISYLIHVVDFLPEKRVLLEEYTHTTCGPCYGGDLDMAQMLAANPLLEGVSIHNGTSDPMNFANGTVLDLYFSFGHPNFVFDRMKYPPSESYGSLVWSGSSFDLTRRLSTKEGLSVSIAEQTYNSATGEMTLTLQADFYADYEDTLCFNAYVLEDSVFGYQANAPNPNQYYHMYVAREILGGPFGVNMPPPTTDGSTITQTFTYQVPPSQMIPQLSVIGFVSRKNGTHLEIINTSSSLPVQESYVGLTPPKETEIRVFPNPVKDILHIESSAPIVEVTIFDLYGRTVFQGKRPEVEIGNLPAGNYMIRILTQSGLHTQLITKEK